MVGLWGWFAVWSGHVLLLVLALYSQVTQLGAGVVLGGPPVSWAPWFFLCACYVCEFLGDSPL